MQAPGTRERLLDAACHVFAEKGFRAATVAEICRIAEANIAAVNYHFGNKEALYKEAWRSSHHAMLGAFPPSGGVAPDAPAEERLRGRIRSLLQRVLSEDGLEFRIVAHEMANPTGLLEQVIQDTIRPLAEATEGIIRELLGDGAEEETLRLCAMSVIGPCLHLMRRQRMQRRLGQDPWFRPERLERLVEHFATFALGGIREVRRQRADGTPPEDRAAAGRP